jgi:hypothetical protein
MPSRKLKLNFEWITNGARKMQVNFKLN